MGKFKEEPYQLPEPSLGKKVDMILERIEKGELESKQKKPKSFRLPFAGKLGKAKLKLGYSTILEINENNTVRFTREPIVDGTVKLRDTFHAVHSDDLLTYKGKPLLIIPKKSNAPFNPNNVKNNTFQQKHIMSRMMNETLDKAKKLGIAGMSIGGIILGGVLIYALVAG